MILNNKKEENRTIVINGKNYYIRTFYIQKGHFMKRKRRYKHAVINKKKYYFYTIRWLDITGDAGHKSKEEMLKLPIAKMITQAYVFKKSKKYLITFNSYDETDEVFSDTNIFPTGCIVSMERIIK